MKNPSILSIDFGSSYTKLSVREGYNETATLVPGGKGQSPWIPTVVTSIVRNGKTTWLTGEAAASQPRTEGVATHRHWKAALFAKDREDLTAAEAVELAIRFFTSLRTTLTTSGELSTLPVRISVPKFEFAGAEGVIRDILVESGWSIADGRSVLFEPETNAIGILTRARNATWMPGRVTGQPGPVHSIHMQQMLEPGLADSFRTMRDAYAVLVTDIGAFTTDFGFVSFDTAFKTNDWSQPTTRQQSVPIGIRNLDVAIFNLLEPEAQSAVRSMSTTAWENHKRQLYAGEPVRLVGTHGRPITIGSGIEGEAIQGKIRSFSRRVIEERDKFIIELRKPILAEDVFSGGGFSIPTLRKALLKARNGVRVQDLLDVEEPMQMVFGQPRRSALEIDARIRMNAQLLRGGSAMGGASVFFE